MHWRVSALSGPHREGHKLWAGARNKGAKVWKELGKATRPARRTSNKVGRPLQRINYVRMEEVINDDIYRSKRQ